MPSDHDLGLVLLSFAIAALASTTALHVASHARESRRADYRVIAVATGAVALGGGVWAMHFIGLLAQRQCFQVRYDLRLTALSCVPALLASAYALHLLANPQLTRARLWAGGVLLGAGIGAMHYSGMFSMVMAPQLRFEPYTLVASLLAAVLLATFALWVRFGVDHHLGRQLKAPGQQLVAGVLMGSAITAMHYLGMASARFIGTAESPVPLPASNHAVLAASVAAVTVTIGLLVLGSNTLLKYRQLVAQLASSEARLQAMFDTAVDGIVTIDARGIIQSINDSALRMFGYQRDELLGQNVKLLMPEPVRSEHDGYVARHAQGGPARTVGIGREVVGSTRDGKLIPIRLAVGGVHDDDSLRYVGFLTDISELKQAQARREHEANHDALTGLLNRRAVFGLLQAALERADRSSQPLALMFVDLDGFKEVNDRHGHAAGDALLVEMARRMRACVRHSDTVARLGGDEFVFILEGFSTTAERDAHSIAVKVLATVREPMPWQGTKLQIDASIGLCLGHAGHGLDADALVSEADSAMYLAKHNGKGAICWAPARQAGAVTPDGLAAPTA